MRYHHEIELKKLKDYYEHETELKKLREYYDLEMELKKLKEYCDHETKSLKIDLADLKISNNVIKEQIAKIDSIVSK